MTNLRALSVAAALLALLPGLGHAADLDYGKPGDPVSLVAGYQPYYAEAWSGAVVNGLQLWKKYLPKGSTVTFTPGLQGAIVVNQMLAGKASIGYLGDMPAIVGASKRRIADLRIVAAIGRSHDQCNVFLARLGAPAPATPADALKWFGGHVVATPKGSCSDRFARVVFSRYKIEPSSYLNQSIELITSGFRAGTLDGAVVWEPTASRLVADGLARRVATGNDLGEADGAFIDMRADLIRQRPDIVRAWLEAELDAERYMADPANAVTVVRLLKAQTTGLPDRTLWQALYGTYPAAQGGSATRLTLPFGFRDEERRLIADSTSFLFSAKAVNMAALPDDSIQAQFTADVLQAHHLTPPVAEVRAEPDSAAPAGK